MTPLSGPALVIGGGTMAVGIAARLVAAGIDTTVLVRREEAVAPARAEIIRRMARLREYHLVTDHGGPGARLAVRHERTDGSFALVVESIAEDLEAKRAVLAEDRPRDVAAAGRALDGDRQAADHGPPRRARLRGQPAAVRAPARGLRPRRDRGMRRPTLTARS